MSWRTVHRRAAAAVLAVQCLSVPGLGLAQDRPDAAELRAHSAEFAKDLITVADGVHIAVGYAASNVILVQGADGVIIIDTGPNPTEAKAIKAAFAPVAKGPVRAIIYTHSHADHTGGAAVFAGGDRPRIIAGFAAPPQAIGRPNQDGADQFGMKAPADLFINAGTQLEFGRDVPPTAEGYLPPTQIVSGARQAMTIAGVRLELIATPGEAADSISVWLPDRKIVATGDDVLKTFPNIAPIRGVPMRSPQEWIASLNTVLALQPAILLPGHMRPIVGADDVRGAVTAYRDAIASINDQTLAGMKRGLRPDELAASVKLPPALAAHPYLRQYYGTAEWMVRGIYATQLGWFDGNPTNLFPRSGAERAADLLPLIGGPAGALAAGRAAIGEGRYAWAAELADLVLAADRANAPAKALKIDALIGLGKAEGNAIARNWDLSVAVHLAGSAQPDH